MEVGYCRCWEGRRDGGKMWRLGENMRMEESCKGGGRNVEMEKRLEELKMEMEKDCGDEGRIHGDGREV